MAASKLLQSCVTDPMNEGVVGVMMLVLTLPASLKYGQGQKHPQSLWMNGWKSGNRV